MSLLQATLCFALSGVLVWGVGFLACAVLRRFGIIDVPNGRSSHERPTVRGGGVTVFLLFLGWLLYQGADAALGGWPLIFGLLLVTGISLFDDVRSLPLSLRLVIHGVGAAFLLWGLAQGVHPMLDSAWIIGGILVWVLVVGYTNAFNFIDGINGLASSQAVLACLFGALFCALTGSLSDPAVQTLIASFLVLGGAVAGFLPHNFPRARMFLGDVGSISIGFAIAALAVLSWHTVGWQAAVAIGALQINVVMDTSLTVLRRAFRGAHLHLPHREFFFHRLVRSGMTHAQVTGVEVGLQIISGCALLLALGTSVFAFLSVVLHVLLGWSLFFAFCEWRFRETREESSSAIHLRDYVPARDEAVSSE